jgi:type I restriction enzyme S subunit
MDFTDSKNKYIDVEKSKELRPHWARLGDILITKMGEPPGGATCYPEGKPVAVITADCLKLTLSSLISKNRGLIVHAINSEVVKQQIKDITQGVAQQKISLARFSQIGLPLAPLLEQNAVLEEIDRRLSVTEELETTIEINLKRAERLRQTILQKAFSGGLV